MMMMMLSATIRALPLLAATVITSVAGDGDGCFHRWVYGYQSEGGATGGYHIEVQPSAQACQELCQASDNCVNFLFSTVTSHCALKDKVMLGKVLNYKLDGSMGIPPFDDEFHLYCNFGMDFLCNGGGYKCLSCRDSGEYSCVWHSDMHWSGPKYCTDPKPEPCTPLQSHDPKSEENMSTDLSTDKSHESDDKSEEQPTDPTSPPPDPPTVQPSSPPTSEPAAPTTTRQKEPGVPMHSTHYSEIYKRYLNGEPLESDYLLADWTTAGYEYGADIVISETLPIFKVSDYETSDEDVENIQSAINAAQENGGGIVLFDARQYDLNKHDDGSGTFEKKHGIWVEGSNIVLQGQTEGDQKTILKQWKRVDRESPLYDNIRSPHTVNIVDSSDTANGIVNWILEDVEVGSTFIPVSRVFERFQVGDRVFLGMQSNKPPAPSTRDLENHLLWPLYSDGLDEYIVGMSYRPYKLYRDVVAVDAGGFTVNLPVPRTLYTEFNAFVYNPARRVNHSGVRDMELHGVHDGSYTEGGYDFGGINFSWVEDCWAENITIKDVLLDVSINDCRHITVRGVDVHGTEGHHGIGVYHSFHSLVENVKYFGSGGKNHMISFNRDATENVVRDVYNWADDVTVVGQGIDFHSGFSSFNLVENVHNSKIASSGALNGNASCGQYNALWNLRKGNEKNEGNGLFCYCFYTSTAHYGAFARYTDCYRRHPRMIYVGIAAYDREKFVTINESTENVIDDWRYIEGLNNYNVYPRSLYEGQKYRDRQVHPEFEMQNPVTLQVGDPFNPLENVSAHSDVYGDISDRIQVHGLVDTSITAEFDITYEVIDDLGLGTSVIRRVDVTPLAAAPSRMSAEVPAAAQRSGSLGKDFCQSPSCPNKK